MKIGRNSPCACGSGKKFKKCHLLINEKAAKDKEASRLKRLQGGGGSSLGIFLSAMMAVGAGVGRRRHH